MSAQASSCFPDILFEEMALGRLDPDLRTQVEEHLSTCQKCAARNQVIHSETHAIQGALRSIEAMPETPCISQLSLALYIDGTMATAECDALEEHLSICGSCQERLIELHHAVAAITKNDPKTQTESLQEPATPLLDLPPAISAIAPQASDNTWLQSLHNLKSSWPLILAALLILAAGAAQFGAPDSISPQLHLVIAASAAFLIHDKVRFHIKKIVPPENRSAPRTGFKILAFWTATGFFTLSFMGQGITSWSLTLSLIAYLAWLFGRTIPSSLPAQDQASLQSTRTEAATEKYKQGEEEFPNIKDSHK